MGNSSLVRLGGFTAVLSGVLLIIGDLSYLFIDDEDFARAAASGAYIVQAVVFLLAGVLLLVGLVGMYLHHSEAAGVLGLILQPHFIRRRPVFARNDSSELGPVFVSASATSAAERHAPQRAASGS